MTRAVLAVFVAHLMFGCGGDDGREASVIPPDYADSYQEVRSCRRSGDHDLMRMRVLAAPDALAVYQARDMPFPAGAIVIKEEYDTADDDCSGPIITYTVMKKLDAGTAPADLDWLWQKTDADLNIKQYEIKRCISCHTACGKPPGGHDGTCTEP